MTQSTIRKAEPADLDVLHQLVKELATFEKNDPNFDQSSKPVGDLILAGRVSIWERNIAHRFLQNLVYVEPRLENWVNILLSHPHSDRRGLYDTGLRLMLSENAFYSGILISGRLDILDAEQQAIMYEIPLLKYNFLIHLKQFLLAITLMIWLFGRHVALKFVK